jgi:hypothetical protein
MPIVTKKRHNAVTVDLQTDEQLNQLSRFFTKKFKTKVSKTDVIRMGITSICTLHPDALIDGGHYAAQKRK